MASPDHDRAVSVALCGSKDCRTRAEHADLAEALTTGSVPCHLIDSRCLDVCSGPVVVVAYGSDRPRVFRKVRTGKQRRDLAALVSGGPMTDRLRAIRVTGKRARKAVARVRPR